MTAATTLLLAAVLGAEEQGFAKKTYTFKTVGDVAIHADVYRPGDTKVRPVLVWIHGGALIKKEEADLGISKKTLTNTEGSGPELKFRGRLYRYYRQNGLWTKEVTGFDPATEPRKLDPYCPVRNITPEYPPLLMIHGTRD